MTKLTTVFSNPLFSDGLQPGTEVALGIGDEVQVEVGDGPLVAVEEGGGVDDGVGVAVGVPVLVGVRVAVDVREAVGVDDEVCEAVGVTDGVGVAVLVSVGVAVSVGVEVSLGVSVGPEVGVTVSGKGEDNCSSGAAVTVSLGWKVGRAVIVGGGAGLGGVGSSAAAICAKISELTGGKRAAVVEAYAAAANVMPQITGTMIRPTSIVDHNGCLRRTRLARLGRVISSMECRMAPA